MKNLLSRIEEKGDLWADFWQSRQRIEPALERLQMNSADSKETKARGDSSSADKASRPRRARTLAIDGADSE
jgi:hypothetical protein